MSIFIKLLGAIFLLAGLALSWSPIPVGILLIPLGAAMIVATSSHAKKWLHQRRVNNPKLDRWLCKMEGKVPERIARPLHETDANSDNR